jgi:predicted Zn-ribbon and HTH transcriptional regulator
MRRIRRTTMAAAQAAYDNMEPPDDHPIWFDCRDCLALFSSDDQRVTNQCPHCCSENIAEHEDDGL